ncbi:MAG TPA: hypothetical protein V6D28_27940 [Leptolyngbyaceae cyanobacterium]
MDNTHDQNEKQQPSYKVRREKREGEPNTHSHNAGDIGRSSFSDEHEQKRRDRKDGQVDEQCGTSHEESDIGGILGQLRRLQQAHLAYVDAHAERLRARLEENQEHRSQVLQDMQRLEAIVLERLQEENQ